MKEKLRNFILILTLTAGANLLVFSGLAFLNTQTAVRPAPFTKADLTIRLVPEEILLDIPAPVDPPPVQELLSKPIAINLDVPAVDLKPLQMPEVQLDFSVPSINVTPISLNPISQPYQAQSQPDFISEQTIDQPPTEDEILHPNYPRTALLQGIEGSVTVRLLINEKGYVEESQVVSVTGYPGFRKETLRVMGNWRFTPPRHQGKPVRVWGRKTIHFRIIQ
ncbi:MAG: energy transducer TonB [Planctomycetes bacterium]|nr:energy transducer TonB [Planctomycetota bacterium]